MVTGLKSTEFRKPSDWIRSRLINKHYDLVKFVNGYGGDKPYFLCEYIGYEISEAAGTVSYAGSTLRYEKGDFIIHLGRVTETGNLET